MCAEVTVGDCKISYQKPQGEGGNFTIYLPDSIFHQTKDFLEINGSLGPFSRLDSTKAFNFRYINLECIYSNQGKRLQTA